MSSVELPGDLVLHGSLVVPLAVHPDRVSLAPQQTQQFSVDGGQTITWAVEPAGRDNISKTGLYTAPATLFETEVATITAVNSEDLSQVGRAMVVSDPSREPASPSLRAT